MRIITLSTLQVNKAKVDHTAITFVIPFIDYRIMQIASEKFIEGHRTKSSIYVKKSIKLKK
jgi:hypothetical protein